MVQLEELQPKPNNKSKKNKEKKIPQRGLGVAQLEKLRIEELQKKNCSSSSSSSLDPSLGLVIPPQQQQQQQQQPSLPFLTSLDHNLILDLNSFQSMDKAATDTASPKCFPILWNAQRNLNSLDSLNFASAMPSNTSFSFSQKSQHSAVAHMSNNISLSSGVDLQIEPPSNQSSNIRNYNAPPPSRQVEERMVGTKRSWSFHSETGYGCTSFVSRPPPPFNASFHRPEDRTLISGSDSMRCQPEYGRFREGASSFASYEAHINKKARENDTSQADDHLLLGSPLAQSISRWREFILVPSQGVVDNAISSSIVSSSQQPFYNFFERRPSISETAIEEESHKLPESVDTNLEDSVDTDLKL